MKLINIGLVAAVCFLSACASFPKNSPLAKADDGSGYRFDNLALGSGNTDSLFVVLVFSGGGTRAASLSYGVMEALRDTPIEWKGQRKRLLDEVDIISSVSGGSFTAAYYGLHRDGLFDGTFEKTFLKHDVQGDLLKKAINPVSWFKLAGRSFGRSDLAAEYHNEHLFNGATFQNLTDTGTRPFIMLNATDMTTGKQFPFIQEQFDLICSDLAALPVARAVATSSAFPGLLTPLTYENHAGSCDYKEPRWIEYAMRDRLDEPERANLAETQRSYYQPNQWTPARRYIHLIDGGVADNIGLRSVLNALESTDPSYSILTKINNKEIEKLVVIVVNAATSVATGRDKSAKVPSVVDVLSTAATVPLDNFSFDTVERLESTVLGFDRGAAMRKECQAFLDQLCEGAKLPGGKLYEFDLYTVQVAFDFLEDPAQRHLYKNLPTTFSLDEDIVDDLKATGRSLLQKDGDFQDLLKDCK